jgi:hypothetical protein
MVSPEFEQHQKDNEALRKSYGVDQRKGFDRDKLKQGNTEGLTADEIAYAQWATSVRYTLWTEANACAAQHSALAEFDAVLNKYCRKVPKGSTVIPEPSESATTTIPDWRPDKPEDFTRWPLPPAVKKRQEEQRRKRRSSSCR